MRLWTCDFFTKPVRTWSGRRTAYILFSLHVGTRRVIASDATITPTTAWSAEQAGHFLRLVAEEDFDRPTILIRDGDGKFGAGFDAVLRDSGCEPKRTAPNAPLMNAFAERWVGTVKRECLDRFVAVGLRHLDHLVGEFVQHYHEERPHQGLGNELI